MELGCKHTSRSKKSSIRHSELHNSKKRLVEDALVHFDLANKDR